MTLPPATKKKVRAAAESRPTPETLYEQALGELALGDYTASGFWSRRAGNLALELLQKQPIDELFYREAALNALLLVHDAAKAAHDIPSAITSLEEAGTLVDKEDAPLLWAQIHEALVVFLLEHAKLNRAKELISDILDIREERQGDHPDLAGTLMLWTRLLYYSANYSGMESVAARAERIYAGQNPPNLLGFTSALNARGLALLHEDRFAEAEPLMRRALEIDEKSYGPAHPNFATNLNNLAHLLQATNRMAEAEPLLRRNHLEILFQFTAVTGHEHPYLRTAIAKYTVLLRGCLKV